MNNKYAIWDKESYIITPVGEVFTAEKWKERYPVANIPTVTIVCAAGEVNGAFFGTLGQMKQYAERQGATFEDGLTNEELLDAIAAFEDAQNTPTNEPTSEERIAAALEYQVMASLPDEVEYNHEL